MRRGRPHEPVKKCYVKAETVQSMIEAKMAATLRDGQEDLSQDPILGRLHEYLDSVMGEILLRQVLWGSNRSGHLHRGEWAGDRFLFTTSEGFRARCGQSIDGWQDVGETMTLQFLSWYDKSR